MVGYLRPPWPTGVRETDGSVRVHEAIFFVHLQVILLAGLRSAGSVLELRDRARSGCACRRWRFSSFAALDACRKDMTRGVARCARDRSLPSVSRWHREGGRVAGGQSEDAGPRS